MDFVGDLVFIVYVRDDVIRKALHELIEVEGYLLHCNAQRLHQLLFVTLVKVLLLLIYSFLYFRQDVDDWVLERGSVQNVDLFLVIRSFCCCIFDVEVYLIVQLVWKTQRSWVEGVGEDEPGAPIVWVKVQLVLIHFLLEVAAHALLL